MPTPEYTKHYNERRARSIQHVKSSGLSPDGIFSFRENYLNVYGLMRDHDKEILDIMESGLSLIDATPTGEQASYIAERRAEGE